MARLPKRLALASAGAIASLVAFTAWALESGGVAEIETHTAEGRVRSTHVWYVEEGGTIWLEAGSPENGWARDVERDPRLAFRSDHREGDFIARPSRDPTAQARLRERLRAKYGLRDLWVGLFVDASRSYAVKLDPAPDAGSEEEP